MRVDAWALVLLLLASMGAAWFSAQRQQIDPQKERVQMEEEVVEDATGHSIPCRHYQRIICGSSIAASVVPQLVNSNRVVMTTKWFADHHDDAFRLSHVPTMSSLHGVESMVAINPDLIIVHSLNHKQERILRLRETGIPVLDLGSMEGWKTLSADIVTLGKVLLQPERSRTLLLTLQRRLEHAAAHIPTEKRKTAMYVGVYGDKLSGGTVGSSYHDMLRFGGLRDIVAGTVDFPWPSFSVEQLLAYDPDVIVTGGGMSGSGMAESLRSMPGVRDMRAVVENRIIVMPEGTDTTGPTLVNAAEVLCDLVYGQVESTEKAQLPLNFSVGSASNLQP